MVDVKDSGTHGSEQTQALERFHVIRPFLEDGVPLAHIARERVIPLRTLSRWVQHYRGAYPLLRRSSAPGCWMSIFSVRKRRLEQHPRGAGRLGGSCHRCQILWNNSTCYSSR